MRFPDVIGHNLEGKHYQLPHDLEGQINVVVLAFDRWQQALVDSWTPALSDFAQQYPALRFYELPTLANYSTREQNLIDGWMRAGIHDRAVRARTITLYTSLPPLFNALDIYVNTIYTLVLDREGSVMWRSTGACMPEKVQSMGRTLAAIFEEVKP